MFPWGEFLIYLLAASGTPGPNTILSMTNGGHLGLRRTLPFLGGIFCGLMVVASLCALFCSALSSVLPQIQPVILALSAAYMLYLAWRLFRSDGELRLTKSGSDFKAGILLQFVNLKVYAYCIVSIQAYILPFYPNNLPAVLGTTSVLVLVAMAMNFCWASFGAAFRALFTRHGRLINRILALVLAACAVRLFL